MNRLKVEIVGIENYLIWASTFVTEENPSYVLKLAKGCYTRTTIHTPRKRKYLGHPSQLN